MHVKQRLGSAARLLRNQVRKRWGFDVRTVRGREHWRAGLEFIWHPFDERTERGAICHVDAFGPPVLFLVRDKDDYIQMHFLSGHFYSEDELKLIQQNYRRGAFLDIGANVGNHALFAAKILRAPRVIAVEPNPDVYRLLRCNIALNDLEDVVEHMPVALSDHAGRGSIKIDESFHNAGLATIIEDDGAVPVQVGDALFAHENIGFVKIDVEGMEMKVLAGLVETISRCRPPLVIEVDDTNIGRFEEFCDNHRYRIIETLKPYRTNTYFVALPQ